MAASARGNGIEDKREIGEIFRGKPKQPMRYKELVLFSVQKYYNFYYHQKKLVLFCYFFHPIKNSHSSNSFTFTI
jgi:hypothetical protein